METRRPDDVKLLVGRRFRAAREVIGPTRDQVARDLATTPQAIANWENGERLLDVLKAAKMAQRWGVSLDWFYWGSMAGLRHDVALAINEKLIELSTQEPISHKLSNLGRRIAPLHNAKVLHPSTLKKRRLR